MIRMKIIAGFQKITMESEKNIYTHIDGNGRKIWLENMSDSRLANLDSLIGRR